MEGKGLPGNSEAFSKSPNSLAAGTDIPPRVSANFSKVSGPVAMNRLKAALGF